MTDNANLFVDISTSVAPIIGSVIGNTLYRLVFRISDIGSVSIVNY